MSESVVLDYQKVIVGLWSESVDVGPLLIPVTEVKLLADGLVTSYTKRC